MSETKTRKTLEEVCPIFRTMLLDSNQITKLYLMSVCGLHTPDEGDWPDVDNTLERYMAQKSGILYYLYDNTECTDSEIASLKLQSNGLPSIKMTEEDMLVCKDILYCSMSNEEKNKFAYLKKMIKDAFYKYYDLKHAIERYDHRDPTNDEDMLFIKQARQCGWFDNIPAPDDAEKKYFGIKKEEKDKAKEERKGKKILGIFDQNSPFGEALNVVMKENGIKPEEVYNDLEPSGNVIDDIATLYGKMNEVKANKNKKEEIKKKESDNSKKLTIDESMVSKVVGEVNEAGFAADLISKLTDDKYSDVRDQIVDAGIDMIGGILKGCIVNNPDEFKKKIESIDSDIVIDTSIEGLNGLRDIVEIVFDTVKKLKKSSSIADSMNIISDAVNKVKANSKVFTSSKFLSFLKKLPVYTMSKDEVIIKNTPETKEGKSVSKEVKEETKPAAMMAPPIAEDDDKPEFCKDGSLPITFEKPQSGKPDFIIQANQVVPAGNGIAKQNTITAYVNNDLRIAHPWLEDLAKIAAKNGVSVTITPIPGTIMKEDGTKEYIPFGCQVRSELNGVFNYMKSFSIDFGHFIDNRYKVLFNTNSSGFFLFDKVENAYTCFKDPKNKTIDDAFFNKVFAMGYNGLNDADNKQFRIINSNMTQLNRVIETITLPTNLPKKERQAIKDSAFKMMRYLKEISRNNEGVEFGRFRVISFDKENLSYTISNENTVLMGVVNTSPRCTIDITIGIDENGNIKTDNNGKAIITFTITMVDNVYDLDKLTYPDGSPIIHKDNSNNKPEHHDVQDMEPVDVDDEGETPEIIQQ